MYRNDNFINRQGHNQNLLIQFERGLFILFFMNYKNNYK